jgi:hypothetical protein
MLIESVKNTLGSLQKALAQLDDEAYTKPVPVLSGVTVGQHVRHIAEMYVRLFDGLSEGVVCYEKRRRDKLIEDSRTAAIELMKRIKAGLDQPDCSLILDANYELLDMPGIRIPTSYLRELAYNLEHTIHHMALIRIGIEANSDIGLESCFGVAPSTIRHRSLTY